jgi:uncharacterized membrane protein (UPF0127 family)
MQSKLLLFLISLFILFVISLWFIFFMPKTKSVKINKTIIKAELAKNYLAQMKGLSGRQNLPENQGMFFLYQESAQRSFWMKNMLIPLDFIWINNKKVVHITKNVKLPQGNQSPQSISSKYEVDAVLEVGAGFCDKYEVKINDLVEY